MRNRIGLGSSGAILGTFAGFLLTAFHFYGFGGLADLWWQALIVAFIFSGFGAALVMMNEKPHWHWGHYMLYGIGGTGSGTFLGAGCFIATYPSVAPFSVATMYAVAISLLCGSLCGIGYRLLSGKAED